MVKAGVVKFKIGQLAEMRTFEDGYRGAWFRCKVNDILPNKKKILLEYYDFELEDPSWVMIYQVPPYARKSKHIKKQLMVRPEYPVIYKKSEMPPINSISQPCVIIDGPWKVGNLVDWFKDDCFWLARIVKILSDDKVQIELPLPPYGQGKEGEEGKHEAYFNELRPSLEWSETKGWSLSTAEGQDLCDAHLIFPTEQGLDMEVEHAASAASLMNASSAASPVNASSAASPVNASSTTRISAEGDRDFEQNEKNVKMDGMVESSESTSSLHVNKREAADKEVKKRDLNVMHEQTIEAALLDFEELINKVEWMQRILQSPGIDATKSSWKFA